MEDILIEMIKIAPSLLWFFFVIVLTAYLYKPFKSNLLPKITTFEAAGIKMSFVGRSIDAALEFGEKSPQWQVTISQQEKDSVLNRARANLKVFNGACILWVDDHPENNNNERRMFNKLGVEVDIALSTSDALKLLCKHDYDIVFSDMVRGDDKEAGINLVNEVCKIRSDLPVIFYVGIFQPDWGIPKHATGITNKPNDLLHYALDILERKKY